MLKDIHVRPVERAEEARYQQSMQTHHYLVRAAQDQRDALVCGHLGRALGGAAVLLCGNLEVRGTRALDRPALSPSV